MDDEAREEAQENYRHFKVWFEDYEWRLQQAAEVNKAWELGHW